MVAITQEVVSVLYVGLASPILSNDMDVLGSPRCRKVVPLVYCNDLLVWCGRGSSFPYIQVSMEQCFGGL